MEFEICMTKLYRISLWSVIRVGPSGVEGTFSVFSNSKNLARLIYWLINLISKKRKMQIKYYQSFVWSPPLSGLRRESCSLMLIFTHIFTNFLSKLILSPTPLPFCVLVTQSSFVASAVAKPLGSWGIWVTSIPLTLMLLSTHYIFCISRWELFGSR